MAEHKILFWRRNSTRTGEHTYTWESVKRILDELNLTSKQVGKSRLTFTMVDDEVLPALSTRFKSLGVHFEVRT